MVNLRTCTVYGRWWKLCFLVLRSVAVRCYIRLNAATGSRGTNFVIVLFTFKLAIKRMKKSYASRSKEEVITNYSCKLGQMSDYAEYGKAMFSTPKNTTSQGLTYGWDQERLSRLVKSICFVPFSRPRQVE